MELEEHSKAAVALLIPAFKPPPNLPNLLTAIRENSDIPIVVVDDGSGSDFAATFDGSRSIPNVTVLSNAVNLGKGATLKHGINFLLVKCPELKGIVTADADGQHRPIDIVAVAVTLREDPARLVLGARNLGPGTPLRSRLGNAISRCVYSLILGLEVQDTQTGLRGLPRTLAERSLSIKSNRYEFETEVLAIASGLGVPIREVPIATVYENNNNCSHFDPFFDSARIYFVLARYGLSSILTAIIDFSIFLSLLSIRHDILLANLGGRFGAFIVQFLLLQKFVFGGRGGVVRFIAFVFYVVGTGIISTILQRELAASLSLGVLGSKIIVETSVFIFNFLFLRDVIFADESDAL